MQADGKPYARFAIADFDGDAQSCPRNAPPCFYGHKWTGHRISAMDLLIAATARCHGLAIATRNVGDFKHCYVRIFNPWEEEDKS